MKSALILIFSFFANFLNGQTPSWQLTLLDPSLDVHAITFDTLGFMWIIDGDALYRFDGANLKRKLHFADEAITSINDISDRFILGTKYGRIIAYNPYNGLIEVIQNTSDYKAISSLYFKDRQNYLSLSYGNGINVVQKGKSQSFTIENGLISNEVYDVSYFNGSYYVASDQGIQIIGLSPEPILLNTLDSQDDLADLVITHLIPFEDYLIYTDYDQHIGIIDKGNNIKNIRLAKAIKLIIFPPIKTRCFYLEIMVFSVSKRQTF